MSGSGKDAFLLLRSLYGNRLYYGECITKTFGNNIRSHRFTDCDYRDDVMLFCKKPGNLSSVLSSFQEASRTLGMFPNRKQRYRILEPTSINVDGNTVDRITEFTYLGSKQTSNGHGKQDIMHRIGLAATAISDLSRVWFQKHLTLVTKLRIYQSCLMSICLYHFEKWTFLPTDAKQLEAFHIRCHKES